MLSLTFSLGGAMPPLGKIDLVSAFAVALVVAAVLLVIWASRPSVIARYSVDARKHADDDPEKSAEKDLRA